MLDKMIHLGGDEVDTLCWSNDSSISTWMAENDMTSVSEVLEYFVNRTVGIARRHGKVPVVWEVLFLKNDFYTPNLR